MSIASQITSLVSAIATAVNGRGAVGPSDYQMWLAQGNTGTLQDYRNAMVGPDEDYAAYFNANLGALPTAGTASETQVGVTQLATAAETAAGTIATKAVTPLRLSTLLNLNRYSSLTALVAALPSVSEGAVATVAKFQLNGTYYHERSYWVKSNGVWVPIPGTKITVSMTTYYVGETQTTAGYISTFAASNSSSLVLPIGTVVVSALAGSNSLVPIEVIWSGSKWIIWNALNIQAGWSSFQNSAVGNGVIEMNITNGMATLNFVLYKSGGMGLDISYMNTVSGFRPSGVIHFAGWTQYQGGNRTSAAMRIESDGNLYLTGNNGVPVDTIAGTVTYRAAN